jgi:2-oxoisovalerate dehydrogenase E1 component
LQDEFCIFAPMQGAAKTNESIGKEEFVNAVLADYKIAVESREASLLGRKLVLTGKAKFGIFGDGKEVAQLAMARVFENGDWRSGYYRDQTFMFATGMSSIKAFFAQLYAHPSAEFEPASAGRSMNGHFATRFLDDKGDWLNQTTMKNCSADISPTAGQMPRLLGLALASKLYRQNKDLHQFTDFSVNGNEIAFGTIGNASTSEGGFWETINAACVLQVPMLMSVWDDGYGISVPAKYQTAKENISEVLAGFQVTDDKPGLKIYRVHGHDYAELCRVYKHAADYCRENHAPVLIHVTEITQPQGHSTSGSHERYKSKERLAWEIEYDCIKKMREWILSNELSTNEELEKIESEAADFVRDAQKESWQDFNGEIKTEIGEFTEICDALSSVCPALSDISSGLKNSLDPLRKDIGNALQQALLACRQLDGSAKQALVNYAAAFKTLNEDRYNSLLYSNSANSVLNVEQIPLETSDEMADGYQIVRACFDAALARDPRVFAFGEDLGKIGDVNQGFSGLQEKYGELRVTDKGIRELSIIGEGIGASMRGLRPIAEIQYLDYLLYAIQILSDDVATLQYRTKGGQKAPLIVRTRGHRLEGVWHSGSPMGMIINALRGMHICVPRDMTRAAGMYNTLLKADEPALVVECLNGYRIKEPMPTNIGEFTVPLGQVETLRTGEDITLVTYGSCCRIAMAAAAELAKYNIEVEVIDIQTLIPFDLNQDIAKSVQNTSRIIFLDEDVPGGASAFMYQQVMEQQGIFKYLDGLPETIAAKAHRPAYGTDGDYFSKPSVDEVFTRIYNIMHEVSPDTWPMF